MSKAVREQYRIVFHTRPNDPTADGNPPLVAGDVGVLATAGSYNNPPGPGETVFTSINDAFQEASSVNNRYQVGLGQNSRFSIYGKPCGAVPQNAARQLTTGEQSEQLYVQGDTISAGLHDAIKFANRVPNVSSIVVRSEAGPEAGMAGDGTDPDTNLNG